MAALREAMKRRGELSSSGSHCRSPHPSNIHDDDLSANPIEEEIFSEDQILEIEQLLSRIGDKKEGCEMTANNSECDDISSAIYTFVECKGNYEQGNAPSNKRHGRSAQERERIWKAHVADAHKFLQQKKAHSISAIAHERRFRERSKQRHKSRAQFHTQTPKLLPSLEDQLSQYAVKANDMALFVELRSR
ncbi:hypothetical protein LSCM1_05272 [Leishmania martiniquensis]|uniref:Uncharacterized protein n=1 Tax=Leishmania martiniquensis TaxID=1580590 RepID=A0A836GN89_9TRYP|nr:hypothetical protein LSCM1_05272 [Leishmania martiniquensis]